MLSRQVNGVIKTFKKDGTTIITVHPETDEERHLIGTAELLSRKKNTPEPVYVQATLFDKKEISPEKKEIQKPAETKGDISDAFASAWKNLEDEDIKDFPF